MPDPLTDVLMLLDGRSVISTGLRAGGPWAMRVAAYEGLKFNALVRGEAWLQVEDGSAPLRVRAGDCFMLTQGTPFVMATDLALPPRDAADVFATAHQGVATRGTGDEFFVVGGKMTLDNALAALLVDVLPEVIHLPAASSRARTVQWLLARLVEELATEEPGGDAQASLVMQMLFIELMRAYLQTAAHPLRGWLAALRDRHIGRALQAIHAEPGRAWTLAELAETAAMSRSGFAARFKAAVGSSALDYLVRWRMHLARRALRQQGQSVAQVAASLGYSSESAFGHAFKRVFGEAPRRHLSTMSQEQAEALAPRSSTTSD